MALTQTNEVGRDASPRRPRAVQARNWRNAQSSFALFFVAAEYDADGSASRPYPHAPEPTSFCTFKYRGSLRD
jgi:hypothetical protein